MSDISTLVSSTWTSLQPFLPIIAAKGAEEIGKRTVGEVWDLVKKKFDTKEAAREAIEDLLKKPDSEAFQTVFKVQLEKMLDNDPEFAAELQKLLPAGTTTAYSATNIGDGAIAQGTGAQAVGAGGVMVGGSVSGNIVVGDKNKIETKKD